MSGMTGVASAYTTVSVSRTLVALGDSITRGVDSGISTSSTGGYRKPLWDAIGSVYVATFVGTVTDNLVTLPDFHEGWNANGIGYTGQAPADIATHGVTAMTAYQPDVVCLMAGTNDLLQPWTTAPIRASMVTRLGTLLDDLHATSPDSWIIVSTLPPIGPVQYALVGITDADRLSFNAAIPGVVASRSSYARAIDPASAMTLATHIADGVHPNPAGYALLGAYFTAAVLALVPAIDSTGTRGRATVTQMTGRASVNQMTGRATARSG